MMSLGGNNDLNTHDTRTGDRIGTRTNNRVSTTKARAIEVAHTTEESFNLTAELSRALYVCMLHQRRAHLALE